MSLEKGRKIFEICFYPLLGILHKGCRAVKPGITMNLKTHFKTSHDRKSGSSFSNNKVLVWCI